MSGGLNRRGRDCVATIATACDVARAENCSSLVVLGDLFDAARPSPPLVAAVGNAFSKFPRTVYVILGNHDRQSQHEADHACASLGAYENVVVVSAPTRMLVKDVDLWLLPYQAGEAKDWLPRDMAILAARAAGNTGHRRVACTHLGVWDDDTPPYLKAAHDAVGLGHARWLCEAHSVGALFAGNWHEFKVWGGPSSGPPGVCIPGTLCPASHSDPSHRYGSVMIYDSVAHSITPRVITTPVFDTWSPEMLGGGGSAMLWRHFQGSPERYAPGYYARVKVTSDRMVEMLQYKGVLENKYPGLVVDLQVDDEAGREAVRGAAREAVGLANDEALVVESYAEDYGGVQDPGTNAGVVERLRSYRKAAR